MHVSNQRRIAHEVLHAIYPDNKGQRGELTNVIDTNNLLHGSYGDSIPDRHHYDVPGGKKDPDRAVDF
jgi:hypothetical protein